MQRAADTSRFLIYLSSDWGLADSESAVSHNTLLQHIVVSLLAHATNSHQVFNHLVQRLIRLAEHAYSLRDTNVLQEVSLVLLNLPASDAREIGQYYQALAIRQNGKIDEALSLLEKAADRAPLVYRARAIQAAGAIHHRQGRFEEALYFYGEALQASLPTNNGRDLLTGLTARLNISGIKSFNGDHQGALADLENLLPIVLIVAKQSPLYFYFYHADLAYELTQVGRIAEAEAACSVALASPFAPAYPEWSETRNEIAAKRQSASPSIVAVNHTTEANSSQQSEPESRKEFVSALAFNRPSPKKDYFQTSIATIAATATIAPNGINQSVLDWMRRCTGPRAPPALARTI